jgi:hypothetical protein
MTNLQLTSSVSCGEQVFDGVDRTRRLRSGRHVDQVRAKPVEFEKGKAGIVVGSKDKLPALIDALIAAVRSGELDELFSQAAKAGAIGKRKAA